jgi:hypothetical protein
LFNQGETLVHQLDYRGVCQARAFETVLLAMTALIGAGGTAQAAGLTMTGPLGLSHGANLIQNGSFEDHPTGGTSAFFWGTGTGATPYATPGFWNANGSLSNYAEWDNTAVFNGSAPLPDGTAGLYFGNSIMSSISQTPTFNADGSLTFTSPPTIVPALGYSPPVTMSQTLTGLSLSTTYGLSFWTSGEDAMTGQGFTHDGIFGLKVTGYNVQYLAAPSGLSTLGTSHVYNFTFTPISANTTITFINWGHSDSATVGWTLGGFSTELVLDDVIVNPLPEPSSVVLGALGLAGFVAWGWRRRKG